MCRLWIELANFMPGKHLLLPDAVAESAVHH
jgi:hypothetical protein